MVYGGALAAGAFSGQSVTLLGSALPSGFWSFLAIALAGTLGHLLGSLTGWAVSAHDRCGVSRFGCYSSR